MSSFDGPRMYPENVPVEPCAERCGRCRACRTAQRYADRKLAAAQRAADRQLANELGIPSDAPLKRATWTDAKVGRITLPDGSPWDKGFRFELFGVSLWDEPAADAAFPWVRHFGFFIQLWQVDIFYQPKSGARSAVFGRVRWDPDRNTDVASIHGIEHNHRIGDVLRIRGALIRWSEIRLSNAGRRRLEDDPYTDWRDIIERAIRRKKRAPALPWREIAKDEGVPWGTFRKWRERYEKLSE